jgi:hypothetical protein
MSKNVTIFYFQRMSCQASVELTDEEYDWLTTKSNFAVSESPRSKNKIEESVYGKIQGDFGSKSIIDSDRELDVSEVRDADK